MAQIQADTAIALAAVRAIGTSGEAFSHYSQLSVFLRQLSDQVSEYRGWLAAQLFDSGQVRSLSHLAELLSVSKSRAAQLVEAGRKRGNPVMDPGTDPEPNVVAVAVIIEPSIGKVLTEHRTDMAPEWTFAGGEIEKGESPVDALQRRVPVETGLEITTGHIIAAGVSERTGRFLRYVVCHLAEPGRAGDATAELDPDADHVQWMTPAELDAAMPDMHPAVRAVIRAELGS
jgi:8-oxo-dGTP pyrophosphatase MutT (NUDIX family)